MTPPMNFLPLFNSEAIEKEARVFPASFHPAFESSKLDFHTLESTETARAVRPRNRARHLRSR